MTILDQLIQTINHYLRDYVLIILLCGTGIFYTLRLGFIQVRRFPAALRRVCGSFSLHGEKAGKDGMTSFQALTTAIAAQVGSGNIVGAATAIHFGGPGAIFWMWVSAFFGMATSYAEAVLSQTHRTTDSAGHITGGPVYYIRAAFRGRLGRVLAGFFSAAIVLALGFTGNMVQSNSISTSFQNAFHVPAPAVGLALALCAAIIFLGGAQRVASFSEKIVPIMAGFYILGCAAILVINAGAVPAAFRTILVGAFDPQAVGGGVAGATMMTAVRYGVARGLFSNEAGMGSTPHAHALARVKHPEDQGVMAMFGVFLDTFIVLALTALVIVSTGAWRSDLDGAALAQAAFDSVYGSFGEAFIAVCMLFFAFSTITSWHFFGQLNVRSLLGPRAVPVYTVIVLGFIFLGSCLRVDLVWNLSDLLNGLMVFPNLLALLALSGAVAAIARQRGGRTPRP